MFTDEQFRELQKDVCDAIPMMDNESVVDHLHYHGWPELKTDHLIGVIRNLLETTDNRLSITDG